MSTPIITPQERAAAMAQRPAASARELQLMESVHLYRARVQQLTQELQQLYGTAQIPWAVMSAEQQQQTLQAMARFGPHFITRLAEAWRVADPVNSLKLGATFCGFVAQYGPGSIFYDQAERRDRA